MYDVIIVGGGPAGLSAALLLGRCRRRVLVCDSGSPRNAVSERLHAFLTRDGITPTELRMIARVQLECYDTVEFRDLEVVDAESAGKNSFVVQLADGSRHRARRLLLCTGVEDILPEIGGIKDFYGKSVFHCPYCDAWEVRDQPIAVVAKGEEGRGLALELLPWSSDLVLCTNGPAELDAEAVAGLARNGIPVREERLLRFEGKNGRLERLVFRDGSTLERRAAFFNTGRRQRSNLPEKFGCVFSPKGAVQTGEHERTNIPGLYVAGDASRNVQFVVVAAAEGAEAGFDINTDLSKEDLL